MAATQDSAAAGDLDERDVRALTEPMDIYAGDPATSETEVAVYNQGTRYIVNPVVGYCDCDDHYYRKPTGGCKHVRRVLFARGERAIPAWVDTAALDDGLGVDA